MNGEPDIQPFAKAKRRNFFWLLLLLFVIAIPLLYLYATGYRFAWKESMNFVSTGGLFIAAEETGVEIYIDDELVRETRVFRKAFYAQNINPGTHRVHVQKDGYHTWVKELPVYPYLVTEVQTFNLPLIPQVRPIVRYETATGSPILFAKTIDIPLLVYASSTEVFTATSSKATSTLVANQEFTDLQKVFGIEEVVVSKTRGVVERIESTLGTGGLLASSSVATTAKEYNNVRLIERGTDIVAEWFGNREGMPYYYCAKDFDALPRKEVSVLEGAKQVAVPILQNKIEKEEIDALLNPPVQTVPADEVCTPEIVIDRKGQPVRYFDFFPGSSDLVMMVLPHGVYAVEVDDRSWQNMQPIVLGEGLEARVYNGHVVVYDGTNFFEVVFE